MRLSAGSPIVVGVLESLFSMQFLISLFSRAFCCEKFKVLAFLFASEMSVKVAVGIDLGTTFSCVAVVKNGQVTTIFNGQGNYTTPSFVTFTDEDALVGEPAKIAAVGNSKNAVFNAKRLIGRSFKDWQTEHTASSSRWPFKVVNRGDQPFFEVQYKNKTQLFSPQEISSFILKDLKKSAEDFLHQPVKDAVISVPANFNYAQRQATEDAAKLAGFNVLRLCSEPAMAGIVHEPLLNIYHKKTLLVFDCGGGTTDVAILAISEDGTYDVMATAGDMYLGGENIVDMLVSHFLDRLEEETGKDFSFNEEAVRRLTKVCEEAKCQLSFAETYTVCFEFEGLTKMWKLTRSRFTTLISKFLDKMLEPVKEAISGAGLEKNQIEDILLAGGTCRIPEVQRRLSVFFDGKTVCKSINPEQAIAQGAAIMAAVLSGDTSSSLSRRQLCEISPLSLNVSIVHGEMLRMVPRNTRLPFSFTTRLYTCVDNQTDVEFGVFEGERLGKADCKHLGDLSLSGFRPARRREVFFDVAFDVSASGVLQATAVEPESRIQTKLNLMSENRQRSSLEVRNMLADAERNVEFDTKLKIRFAELKNLTNLVYSRKHKLEDENDRASPEFVQCGNALDWIHENGANATMEEIIKRKASFECN